MPDWLIPILAVIAGVSGIVAPVQLLLHRSRSGDLRELKDDIKHIDGCLDRLREAVAAAMARSVTREEVDASLLRMRNAVSADTGGLHDRLMRLEAPYFHARPSDG